MPTSSIDLERKKETGELKPLYTMANGHNHVIVRALETHPKAIPWKIQIQFCVATGLLGVV